MEKNSVVMLVQQGIENMADPEVAQVGVEKGGTLVLCTNDKHVYYITVVDGGVFSGAALHKLFSCLS